jgi:hypothetical protein
MAGKKEKRIKKDDAEKDGKSATWIVAISGLIAAIAALVSAIATLLMALK